MNLSTAALILLAWQLLSNSNKRQPQAAPQLKIADILSDDVKNVLSSAQKLSDKNCSQSDRAGAIFEIISNPALQNLASNIFGNTGSNNSATPQEQPQQTDPNVNSEGYRFETPSVDSQEFFRPIDNIADAEIKHKLYWFYDNWYNK